MIEGTGSVSVAAIDLGASSGRVMLGEVGPDHLSLTAAARFPNGPVPAADGLHWDASSLHRHALDGLRDAAAAAPGGLVSVGIDSWAVDYGLLHDGRLLVEPFHYRDQQRGEAGPRMVHERVAPADLYARTGLQHLPFNTLYQLAADTRLAEADRILLVPDLLAFWLTGAEVAERTNASTTGLLSVTSGLWDDELIERLGLRRGLFADLVDPGDTIGTLLPAVGDASALRASPSSPSAPTTPPRPWSAYLSPATTRRTSPSAPGSLVGLELDAPVLTEAARAANFTHEGGVDGTIRFLTNVMGPGCSSETLRTWAPRRPRRPARGGRRRHRPAHCLRRPGPSLRRTRRHAGTHRSLARGARRAAARRRRRAWCARSSRASRPRSPPRSADRLHAWPAGPPAGARRRRRQPEHPALPGSSPTALGAARLAGPVEATAFGNALVQGRAPGADIPTSPRCGPSSARRTTYDGTTRAPASTGTQPTTASVAHRTRG